MKPLIAIDDWKLPVFQKGLEDAGFEFEVSPGISASTLFLSLNITPDRFTLLHEVVKKCQIKSAELKN